MFKKAARVDSAPRADIYRYLDAEYYSLGDEDPGLLEVERQKEDQCMHILKHLPATANLTVS